VNHKSLCVASLLVVMFATCGLDGGALSVGQALVPILSAGALTVWSFAQTDWWEPIERGENDNAKGPR